MARNLHPIIIRSGISRLWKNNVSSKHYTNYFLSNLAIFMKINRALFFCRIILVDLKIIRIKWINKILLYAIIFRLPPKRRSARGVTKFLRLCKNIKRINKKIWKKVFFGLWLWLEKRWYYFQKIEIQKYLKKYIFYNSQCFLVDPLEHASRSKTKKRKAMQWYLYKIRLNNKNATRRLLRKIWLFEKLKFTKLFILKTRKLTNNLLKKGFNLYYNRVIFMKQKAKIQNIYKKKVKNKKELKIVYSLNNKQLKNPILKTLNRYFFLLNYLKLNKKVKNFKINSVLKKEFNICKNKIKNYLIIQRKWMQIFTLKRVLIKKLFKRKLMFFLKKYYRRFIKAWQYNKKLFRKSRRNKILDVYSLHLLKEKRNFKKFRNKAYTFELSKKLRGKVQNSRTFGHNILRLVKYCTKFIHKVDLSRLIVRMIVMELQRDKRHWPFLRELKRLFVRHLLLLNNTFVAMRFIFVGKLRGARRSRKVIYNITKKFIPFQTFNINLQNASSFVNSVYGSIGIHMYIWFSDEKISITKSS